MYPQFEDETEDSIPKPEAALSRMVEDRLYWSEQDPEFRSYVDSNYKAVYGDEAAEQDATGRTMSPAARPVALAPFRPSVTPEDTNLAGGVGEGQANAWRDVLKVQKGLSNTGHYALDMAKEKSGEHSPTLAQAIRNFQREKLEEIDGILLPGGPTITRMKENLFGGVSKRSDPPRSSPDETGAGAIPIRWQPPTLGNTPGSQSVVPVQDNSNREPQAEPPRSRPTPEQLRYLQGGDMNTVKFEVLPRGRYPRDPHGLDYPRGPYDPHGLNEPPKALSLTDDDIDYMTRLIEKEAPDSHGDVGKQGVLFVILNRMAVGQYFGGDAAIRVMNKRGAFEPVATHGRGDVRNLDGVSPETIARTKQWIEQIQSGELTDPTGGALYFLNRKVAQSRGRTRRDGTKTTQDFGADSEPLMVVGPAHERHHFYNRYKGGPPESVPAYEVNHRTRGR